MEDSVRLGPLLVSVARLLTARAPSYTGSSTPSQEADELNFSSTPAFLDVQILPMDGELLMEDQHVIQLYVIASELRLY